MPKRFLGNIMTDAPTAPDGPYASSAASGVWSLAEVLSYTKGGLWPTTGNTAPFAFIGANGNYQRTFIPSLGNAVAWGTAFDSEAGTMAASSSTRGLWAGGAGTTQIQYLTFSTSGSGADFGDLAYSKGTAGGGFGNETRGIFAGGQGDPRDSIQYVTISSVGNATDFGDLSTEDFSAGSGAFASTTRGVIAESTNANNNRIDHVTIGSAGNSSSFGDLTGVLDRKEFCGASNSTRGLFAGGTESGGTKHNIIDFVTIASTGNTTDFGNLTQAREALAGSASKTRALFQGGSTGSPKNTIDYVEIASTGNAVDFGNLTSTKYQISGCSNSHGGIA